MSLRPGDTVDRYVIDELLGRGGMGAVYRAHDPRLNRKVALKIVPPRLDAQDDAGSDGATRMLREARAAAALDHPNVVSVFDVGEVDGAPYIAMELVDGRSLRAFIGDATTPMSDRIRWLADVARGLHAAHARGLVHRDIKPENVMVRADGIVKVLDFGIARRAHAARAEVLRTTTADGLAVGTPLYMAPEQIRGEKIDGRADQFSWGVLAYELLSGETPWARPRDGAALVAAIVSKEPASLVGVAPGVSEEAAAVVHRALAKDPAARFSSMREIADLLDPAVSQRRPDVAVVPTDRAAVHVAPARSRRRAAFAGAAAIAVAAAVALVTSKRLAPTSGPTSAHASVASATAPTPTALTDLALPESSNPEAVVAYKSAMQAYRDGATTSHRASLERVVALDPAMALGQLRLAEIEFGQASISAARAAFEKATQLRAALSPRDLAFYSLNEALIPRSPPDWAEAERRVTDALTAYPLDAELVFDRGWLRLMRGELDRARVDFVRALEIDPKFATAAAFVGEVDESEGKLDDALASYDRCLRISHGATLCLKRRIEVFAERGECARARDDADALVASAPTDASGYDLRAILLGRDGASEDTLREILRQQADATPAPRREGVRLDGLVRAALWNGRFGDAGALEPSIETALAPTLDAKPHSRAAWLLAQAKVEAGALADAGRIARAFLEHRDRWVLGTTDFGVFADETPRLLELAHRAGALTAEQRAARQRAWIAEWASSFHAKEGERMIAVAAFVLPAETRAEAIDAVGRLASMPTLTTEWPRNREFIVGKARFLAGQLDAAIPFLRRAAGACFAFDMPVDATRASLMLGDALAAKGDAAGACAAYGVVLGRWGKATPRSVTADAARRGAAKLACPR